MKARDFFQEHLLFTHEQFAKEVRPNGGGSATLDSLLGYHVKAGHLLRIRRGLYVVVPPGSKSVGRPFDPYLLAGYLADDAVLAYQTALGFYGKAYSLRQDFVYLTSRRSRPLTFRGQHFRARGFPKALSVKGKETFEVKTAERLGVNVRVTSLERTLVDLLDQPRLSGGWEEIWRSLELIEFFNLDKIIEYTRLLDNATTAAKVGLFLDQHREQLSVTDQHLGLLRQLKPKEPHYLIRQDRNPGRLVSEWNLIVPASILDRTWEEPR